jgi:L-asparaginase
MARITLITTGGTIEKTYEERTGTLENRRTIVNRMLARLRLEGVSIRLHELMSKDSLTMTEDDRKRIVEAVRAAGGSKSLPGPTDGIVILHGTDTLTVTGDEICRQVGDAAVPIVLTGAMRPYEMKRSDAIQNLTEAIFAAGHLPAGVYCVAHGRALQFPGVRKDRDMGTFVGNEFGGKG